MPPPERGVTNPVSAIECPVNVRPASQTPRWEKSRTPRRTGPLAGSAEKVVSPPDGLAPTLPPWRFAEKAPSAPGVTTKIASTGIRSSSAILGARAWSWPCAESVSG